METDRKHEDSKSSTQRPQTETTPEASPKVKSSTTSDHKETNSDPQTEKQQWNEHFMKIACLAALRSKDPRTPVGACIIDENQKVVGIGYNSMPYKKENDKSFSWKSSDSTSTPDTQNPALKTDIQEEPDGPSRNNKKQNPRIETKEPYVVHAAVNAIINRTIDSLKGCAIYVTLPPDEDCAHAIITSRISKVYYCEYRRSDATSPRHEGIEKGRTILRYYGTIELIKLERLQAEQPETEAKLIDPIKKLEERLESGPDSETFHISWDRFFIELARLSRKRPLKNDKKPKSIHGACIVSPEKQVMSIASSGYPPEMEQPPDEDNDSDYITHAEARAIIGGPKVRGCTIYATLYPCNKCAQLIVQSGITEVVYEREFGDVEGQTILKLCLGEEHIKRFTQENNEAYITYKYTSKKKV